MKTPSNNDFGNTLRRCRKQAGLTQAQLGAAVGVSNRVICYYERESSHPPTHLLEKIARVLNVTADELLGIEPAKLDGRRAEAKFMKNWQRLPEDQRKQVAKLVETMVGQDSQIV